MPSPPHLPLVRRSHYTLLTRIPLHRSVITSPRCVAAVAIHFPRAPTHDRMHRAGGGVAAAKGQECRKGAVGRREGGAWKR